MAKIIFPHYPLGEFDSLEEAVLKLNKMYRNWSMYTLNEIVRNNICYRDHLRQYGINLLIEKLLEEAPELKYDQPALRYLRECWKKEGYIAAYDVQCYNIEDSITVLGHTFHGLKDVIEHRGIICYECMSRLECFAPKKLNEYSDIHIGEIYNCYPRFDSSDFGDNRAYHNYIFRNKPITEDDLKEAFQISHNCNFNMVHENIPQEQLPILYYSGDGNYMLLASSK